LPLILGDDKREAETLRREEEIPWLKPVVYGLLYICERNEYASRRRRRKEKYHVPFFPLDARPLADEAEVVTLFA